MLTSAALLILIAFPGLLQSNFYAGRKHSHNYYLSSTPFYVVPEAYRKMVIGVVILLATVTFMAGIGICRSKKWGFYLALAPASIWLIIDFNSVRTIVYGLFYAGIFLAYLVGRLSGKIGPPLN